MIKKIPSSCRIYPWHYQLKMTHLLLNIMPGTFLTKLLLISYPHQQLVLLAYNSKSQTCHELITGFFQILTDLVLNYFSLIKVFPQ